jgi:hypothetical protein
MGLCWPVVISILEKAAFRLPCSPGSKGPTVGRPTRSRVVWLNREGSENSALFSAIPHKIGFGIIKSILVKFGLERNDLLSVR